METDTLRRLCVVLLIAIGISGCAYFPWQSADLLSLEVEDLYLEAHEDRIQVTITNVFDSKILVRRLTASTRDRFYEKTDLAVLEPGDEVVVPIPYTPQFLQSNEVEVQIRYALYAAAAGQWPPPDRDRTAKVSERVTIDRLKFSFPKARRAAGFNPRRFFYMKRWSRTWVFESKDGRTVFLNGVNQHTFRGPWYDLARRVERSNGESVPLEFRTAGPALATALGKEYAITQNGNALAVALKPERFIRVVRAVKAAGYVLAPGEKDGTLKKE